MNHILSHQMDPSWCLVGSGTFHLSLLTLHILWSNSGPIELDRVQLVTAAYPTRDGGGFTAITLADRSHRPHNHSNNVHAPALSSVQP